ncbi:hypothetical protein AB2L28_13575 [Kineococcus sp. TBRC 1896]|uniref:Polysaccharide biosynthesis protein C-terminal domain-containing protein n=1 Tax=Kineococcus mangrovi TaxID=1660183 RepID=A0ABV4I440_9ACTN
MPASTTHTAHTTTALQIGVKVLPRLLLVGAPTGAVLGAGLGAVFATVNDDSQMLMGAIGAGAGCLMATVVQLLNTVVVATVWRWRPGAFHLAHALTPVLATAAAAVSITSVLDVWGIPTAIGLGVPLVYGLLALAIALMSVRWCLRPAAHSLYDRA